MNFLFKGKKVVKLEYEAYVPMAARELGKLCEGVRERWRDVHAMAVHHRDRSGWHLEAFETGWNVGKRKMSENLI